MCVYYYKLCIFLRILKYCTKSVARPSLTSSRKHFFPVGAISVCQVASLSKFEYKCIHQPRRNNVVNYSSKTRLRRRSIRQFRAHNTRWILLQLAAIAMIDRIVSNDRVADYGIYVSILACAHGCTRTRRQTVSMYHRGTTKNTTRRGRRESDRHTQVSPNELSN